MLHSVGNNLDQVSLKPGTLKDFFSGAGGKKGQTDDNLFEGLSVIVLSTNLLNETQLIEIIFKNDIV